jgi:hypothetical protein
MTSDQISTAGWAHHFQIAIVLVVRFVLVPEHFTFPGFLALELSRMSYSVTAQIKNSACLVSAWLAPGTFHYCTRSALSPFATFY